MTLKTFHNINLFACTFCTGTLGFLWWANPTPGGLILVAISAGVTLIWALD